MKFSPKHPLLAVSTLFLLLADFAVGQIIDFETMPSASPVDDLVISDQFRTSHGVRFRLDTDGDGLPDADLPRLEATGPDGTDGFVGFGARDVPDPESAARLDGFFMRSHLGGTGGTRAPLSLIVVYDAPVSGASAEIWDIDGSTRTEQWQVDALGARYLSANDTTDVVDSILSPLGDNHLLNAKPWTFSFDHHGTADIHALRIQFVGSKTGSIGLAFDNFSTSTPAPELDTCGSGLPPVRSSQYDGTTASTVRFEHQPQFNASVRTTIEAWVYRESATRCETIAGQDFTNSLWFGFCPNLRFYRSGGTQATADIGVPAHRWTHVAVSYDGTTARFYINGERAGQKPLANAGTGGQLPLFLGGEAGGIPFAGCLDEIRIWSVVRSEAQIRNGMHQEIRSAPELAAVFPEGGLNEALAGLRGTSTSAPEEKVWGMLPNYLVVPRVGSSAINFDGKPVVETEYVGAEELPIRYDEGPDGHAYLVHTDEPGEGDDKLYVALTGLREAPSGPARNLAQVAVFLDADRSRSTVPGSRDFRLQASMEGTKSADIFGNGSGDWRGAANLDDSFFVSSYDIKRALPGAGEFGTPVFEFQISKPFVQDFAGRTGFGFAHFNAENLFDTDAAPGFVKSNAPATWTCLTFGDDANRPSTRPEIQLAIRDQSGTALPDYQWWIRDAGTGEVLAEYRTPSSGAMRFNPWLPADRPLRIQIASCTGCTHLETEVSSSGVQPDAVSSLQVDFPAQLAGSYPTFASIAFNLDLPLPPLVFTGIAESSAPAPTIMRTVPNRKVVPEVSKITLLGEHFHPGYEVYLYNCPTIPPNNSSNCQEGVHYIRCGASSVSADRTTMTVCLPEGAPVGQWDIAIRGNGLTPAEQWKRRGPIVLTYPDFPEIYGFEFENDPDKHEFDGTNWPLFTAVFGDNVFRGGCLPDPMYGLFAGVFHAVDRSISGTCVGMASTSRLFAMSELDPADSAANYAFGIPGLPHPTRSGRFVPPQPDRYTRIGFCQGHRPTNIWGHIRRNHMVQLSHEVLEAFFDQVDGRIQDGGDPRGVSQKLETFPGNYVLSIKRGGSAHCVTPYRVHPGFKVSADGNSKTEDSTTVSWNAGIPRYRTIEIYDNNYPGRSRFLGIDWELNEFFYDGGLNADLTPRPDYRGKAIFTLPISIWQNERTRPRIVQDGVEILYEIVSGDANVEHEDVSGNRWGWNASGDFQENYPGAKTLFLMDGREDDMRNALFFPPAGTVPQKTTIHGLGGDYSFHADQGSVMVQLHATGTPGKSDAVELQTNASGLCGLRFVPQVARTGVRACLGTEFGPDQSVSFDLSEIALDGKRGLVIDLLEGEAGVKVVNEGTASLSYQLRINAADSAAGLANDQAFGEITVPAGAAQTIALASWPQNTSVRAETDLNNDGTVDATAFVGALPRPQLNIRRDGGEVELTWQHLPDATLMSSSDLANWTLVAGVVINGDQASYRAPLPDGDGRMFFQLRE